MPPPPATAAASRPRTRRTKKAKRKGLTIGGGGGIKIKPFVRPPSLPANFYDTTTATLMRALGCVLREEPLFVEDVDVEGRGGEGSGGRVCASPKSAVDGPNPANVGPAATMTPSDAVDADATSSPMDLDTQLSAKLSTVSTKLSAKPQLQEQRGKRRPMSREELYRLVEDMVTHSFGPQLYAEVVRAIDDAALVCLGRMVDVAPGCVLVGNNDNGAVMFLPTTPTTSSSSSYGGSGAASSESEIILSNVDRVCSSFYEYLRCVRSVFLHLDRRFIFVPGGAGDGDWKSGKAIPRGTSGIGSTMNPSMTGGSSGGGGGSGPKSWGLWDVGMACLRDHMTASSSASSSTITARPSAAPSTSAPTPSASTAAAAAAEARMAMTSTTSSSLVAATAATTSTGDYQTILSTVTVHVVSTLLRSLDSIAIDSTLTRSVIRTVGDLGPISSRGLLSVLVAKLTAYFDSECRRWMDMSGVGGSGDVVGYLRHVDERLKQVGHLASFYLGGIGSSSSSSTSSFSADRMDIDGADDGEVGDESASSVLLLSIVEKHLLRPHYNPQHILHPTVLYKLLDDESRIVPDIKRLYTLGKRVHGGIASLRTAFGQYGRERGLEVVRSDAAGAGAVAGAAGAGAATGGGATSKAESRDAKLKIVPNLLSCKSHLEQLQIRAFGNDETFDRVVRNVLEEVCNAGSESGDDDGDGGRKVAELLAKYVDLRFKNAKTGSSMATSTAASAAAMVARADSSFSGASAAVGGTTESEMELFQTAVLSLFRHIHSKDVFEAFYKRDLAKRLLLNKSVSLDAERALVSKLKAECGGGYTAKMEGMFKDVELSRDVMTNYAAHLHGLSDVERAKVGSVEMDVQVLTTGYWPVYPQYANLTLPPALVAHKQRFETYYAAKYQGRRVSWQHALGNCIVRAKFPKISAPRDLVVSLCQALVLLCFNLDQDEPESDSQGLTILDVMTQSGIDDRGETERVLQSLSLGRDGTRVLVKFDRDGPPDEASVAEPKKPRKIRRSVSDHDFFKFNKSFTSNQRRIRITNVQMKETSEERSKTHEAVSRDRLYLIDATVVRIMKARKTLDHRALMGETMAQLKFPASSADIKKRIESLIEREYMERAEGDRSRYNYLA